MYKVITLYDQHYMSFPPATQSMIQAVTACAKTNYGENTLDSQ
jgi:hypothetical protein